MLSRLLDSATQKHILNLLGNLTYIANLMHFTFFKCVACVCPGFVQNEVACADHYLGSIVKVI